MSYVASIFGQERDNLQKSQFLKAMADMWTSFDARVLRYKVQYASCRLFLYLCLSKIVVEEHNEFDVEDLFE